MQLTYATETIDYFTLPKMTCPECTDTTYATELNCPERRDITKKNVKNHSYTPNINLLAIVSLSHLRSHVIRTSNNLSEPFTYTSQTNSTLGKHYKVKKYSIRQATVSAQLCPLTISSTSDRWAKMESFNNSYIGY